MTSQQATTFSPDAIPQDKLEDAVLKFLTEQKTFVRYFETTHTIALQFGWDGRQYPERLQTRINKILHAMAEKKQVVKYGVSQPYPCPVEKKWATKLRGGPYWAMPHIERAGKEAVQAMKDTENANLGLAKALKVRLLNVGAAPDTTHVSSSARGVGHVTLAAADMEMILNKLEKP